MQRKRRNWKLGLGIAAGVLALLAICGLVGWRLLMTYFQNLYYRTEYAPLELAVDDAGDCPAEHHLEDVPWFATEEAYCQSNSLHMIAAQQGIEEPRGRFDFLMGFTYGSTEVPGELTFLPYSDPEAGFVFAAPYLGLVRRYYVTDDDALYLDALRYYLSRGYPVRVGLDMGVLYGAEEQLPHSEILVGYDEAGFYYYETVCTSPASCEPGRRPPGDEGLYVPDQRLLDAVLGQATLVSYPWRYTFTIFEPRALEEDLGPVWTRNGQLLVGGAQYGPRQGADAIETLAARVEERGVKTDVAANRLGLEAAVYTRRDNAAYLRETFARQPDVERAAALFSRAADDYQAVLDSVQDGVADQAEADGIAAWLRDAAAAEREAGEIFLARGR